MRNEFYKVTCNLDILDGDPNLIFFEKYLVFEKYFLEKYFLIPLPMSLPHKELKQIINTKKKKIKKGNKITNFTILHYNHPIKVKKLLKHLFATYVPKTTE